MKWIFINGIDGKIINSDEIIKKEIRLGRGVSHSLLFWMSDNSVIEIAKGNLGMCNWILTRFEKFIFNKRVRSIDFNEIKSDWKFIIRDLV